LATLRLAHRGDWRAAPENSLAAMEAALGGPLCDGLEFDVRVSADGVAVLLHDETLARVQKVQAQCVTLTAAELATHGIPTLTQVLGVTDCEFFLDVELKEPVPAAIDALELERGRTGEDGGPTLRNAAFSAFEPATLRWLAERRPAWPRWLNAYDLGSATIAAAVELGCSAISAEWHAIDAAGVARARGAGLDVAAWTVRDAKDYRSLEALGLFGICVEGAALDG
jgi:glycerophosphoryl diester phosphodiesterase